MKEFGDEIGSIEQDTIQFQDFIKKPANQDVYRYDITEAEQEALNRWNKNDEHMVSIFYDRRMCNQMKLSMDMTK